MALHDYIVEEVALDWADGLVSRREALRRLGLLGLSTTAAAAVLAACGDDDDSSADTAADATAAPDPASTPPPSTTPDTAGAAPVGSTAPATAASAPSTAAPGGEEIRFAGPNGELLGVAGDGVAGDRRRARDPREPRPHRAHPLDPALAWRPTATRRWRSTCCPPRAARPACRARATPPRRWATHPPSGLIADLRAGLDELERRAPGAPARRHRVLLRRRHDVAAARGRRAAARRGGAVLRPVPGRLEPRRVTERRRAGHLRRARRSGQRLAPAPPRPPSRRPA